MAKKLYEESSIAAIADAIREVGLTNSGYTVSQMAGAILALKNGVQIPPILHDLIVNSAGTYRPEDGGYDGFDVVKVDIATGGLVNFEVTLSASGYSISSSYDNIDFDELESAVTVVSI